VSGDFNGAPSNFALTGAAGFIAPRHLKAIRDTGHRLVAAIDPFDSVGILDSYFPDCAFFTEYERFDRHLEKLRRAAPHEQVRFVSVCSPNHLHDAHIRTALRVGADAICEKPLVLNPWNLDALAELEAETGRRVWTILQLRAHPALEALRERIRSEGAGRRREVLLTYITSRGQWYLRSWKGISERSGGVATNIGVHFFDLLAWLFGGVGEIRVHRRDDRTCAGLLELEGARVRWFLSIDAAHLPPERRAAGERTFRSITVDGEEIEFSGGFADLHTEVYRRTLAGEGFGIEDARGSIEAVQRIRSAEIFAAGGDAHPLLA
jgi:UDP-N-acetyl-2-amino-2-deoxyglucuronate dehydrogenase